MCNGIDRRWIRRARTATLAIVLGIGVMGCVRTPVYVTGNPVGAAVSSFLAFAVGAIIPLLPWFVGEGTAAIVGSAVLGLVTAAAVGIVLARFTERSPFRTALRQVSWAAAACGVTWLIGTWVGAAVT